MSACSLSKMISFKKVDMRSKYQPFDAFLSDKGRLIYSAPFRRMQQKAQVFSLESNSAVRSRLSHSLEVAHIGTYIAHAITKKLEENKVKEHSNEEFWLKNQLSISTIIETTCLMHDVGNPPFGHFGESTISEWFKDDARLAEILIKAKIIDDEKSLCDCDKEKLNLNDFVLFDGNPQAIRIATKLQGEDGQTGLNFTYTQIAASLKYTHGGKSYVKNKENHLSSKLGYFSTEEEIINKTWKALSIPKNGRHPLTFIMEAADDISYCTSDIDDGIENGVIRDTEIFEYLIKKVKPLNSKNKDIAEIIKICNGKHNNKKISKFTKLKTTLSKKLVSHAAEVFTSNFSKIMSFELNTPLLDEKKESDNILLILQLLKEFTREKIFKHSGVELIELSGHSIICGILNCYRPLLELKSDDFIKLIENQKSDVSKVTERLFRTLPNKYKKSYEVQIKENKNNAFIEWNLRTHLIIDFLSGMTDQFALELYQSLAGIKVK